MDVGLKAVLIRVVDRKVKVVTRFENGRIDGRCLISCA